MENCLFCSPEITERKVAESELVFAIEDIFPVTLGHTLVIPKRHAADFFEMTAAEKADAMALIDELRENILADDDTVVGFNIGMNCGKVSGQTVMHAHIHLIPRREGDTERPRGGVRGVIPEKMDY